MTAKPLPTINDVTRPYWEAARRNELHIQRCPRCQVHFLYPTPWCPHCWHVKPQWVVASGRGSVLACTVVHQSALAAYRGDLPYVLAIVQLAEGPQLMANVVDCTPGDVRVGMPVSVVFEQRGDLKVPQFTPAVLTSEDVIPASRKARS